MGNEHKQHNEPEREEPRRQREEKSRKPGSIRTMAPSFPSVTRSVRSNPE